MAHAEPGHDAALVVQVAPTHAASCPSPIHKHTQYCHISAGHDSSVDDTLGQVLTRWCVSRAAEAVAPLPP